MKRILLAVAVVICGLLGSQTAQGQLFSQPGQPQLRFVGTETYQANGKVWTAYKLSVENWQLFPNHMFEWIDRNASRTHVTIRDEKGKSVYGFTTFSQPHHMTNLWFSTEVGKHPPRSVYVEVYDRVQKVKYTSTPVRLW